MPVVTPVIRTESSPIATFYTRTPTATPTPDPAIAGGGVLTLAQKQRLAAAALAYVADTESDAIRIANSLRYLNTAAHPASICGPLSIAILQDAGLLDIAIDRHDFWQLNPRPTLGLPTLERTFPVDRYEWINVTTRLDEVDFQTSPLFPGDFLYTYAGLNGSFEHMLVISRVDSQGRAFAVTNLNTPGGYIIQEVMLYDPGHPGIGMFYDWTNLAYNSIGNTGFGGFSIWRPSIPIEDPEPDVAALRAAVAEQIQNIGGHWNIFFFQIGGDAFLERLIEEPIHPASTIKVPIAMLFLGVLEDMGVSDLSIFLASHVIGGRPMDQLLRFMLVHSEEAATILLTDWIEEYSNYIESLSAWGVTHTTLDPRSTTLHELGQLYEALYLGTGISPAARQVILDLLTEYTPNDDTRLGSLRTLLGEGSIVYNKRGTITADRLIVADAAIVEFKGNAYVILVIAQPEPSQTNLTYEQLEHAFSDLTRLIANFLLESFGTQP